MSKKEMLRKVIDDITEVRCVGGPGIIREEVWEDEVGVIVRYNLAFVNHFLSSRDNGRVLGYDSSHGYHHRHFHGTVEPIIFTSYSELYIKFFDEVEQLRKERS